MRDIVLSAWKMPLPPRADGPVWTKHTQGLFCRSAEIDEHEDLVPNIVLVTGDASATICPSGLNRNDRDSVQRDK